MGSTLDILLEVFTWVGLGAGVVFAGVTLTVVLADGTWLPASAVVETTPSGRVVRWFADDGGVGEAVLSPSDDEHVGSADTVDLFYRLGSNRIRFSRRAPAIRPALWLAIGCAAVGVLSAVVSIVLMIVEG
ncbi:hypothetical protein [Microbacterium caowuchunii]|uniref:Uncharacterized protein n=1 Tax=Microbacterium caowuchunii TaxID=2614638 RepID=A0A5N0T8R8_9MICO|nr:hypothetical protein [Microbacterium caowuchunii]KAA9131151.1 hypothetical protein F6B40_12670 [Microbacterium caowuchunii]